MRILKLLFSVLITLWLTAHSSGQTEEKPLFTFGVIADVQYADIPNAGTRHYRKSPAKLAEAVNAFNASEVDFVLSLGDFINDDLNGFSVLNPITDKLKMPLWHVAGNHDFDPSEPDAKLTAKLMGLDSLYYAFQMKGWRFIALNGNDVSMFAHKEGSPGYLGAEQIISELKDAGAQNARPWNGAVGTRQLEWLNFELEQAAAQSEKVIIACHFPLFSSKKEGTLLNANEVNTVIEQHPHVVAFLSGHGHISQHIQHGGIHHIMFFGMVEGKKNAWAMVKVFENRIEIKGFGNENDRNILLY